MKHLIMGLGIWSVAAFCWAQPKAKPVEEPQAPVMPEDTVVTSRTKQFRISGGNQFGRGLCVILAENAKEELLQLLEVPDDWKIPINVVLYGEPGDEVPRTTLVTRRKVVNGFNLLQLDMHLAEGLRVERYKRAISEMLLYERTLRAQPQIQEGMSLSVPPWLSVGMREAIAWGMQQSDRRLYAAMFKQDGTYKVEDLLGVDRATYSRFDEASEVAFRVSAGSLVMALLQQPQGRKAFREFLDDAASFEGEMALLLRRHFPELNLSPNSLSKWWALQMANQGGLNLLTDVMNIAETEDQLTKALQLDLPAMPDAGRKEASWVGMEQWAILKELDAKQRAAAVKPAQAALVHLSYRCFPSYRPLLVEYQKQLIRLAQGEDQVVEPALEELLRARQIMGDKSQRGRDYLDWFEITRARKTSGVFDDYLKLKQQLKEQENNRKDGVSRYLDRMDELFDRTEQK